MKIKGFLLVAIFCVLSFYVKGQGPNFVLGKNDTLKVAVTNIDGEWMPWVVLNQVSVIDKRAFKSQEDYNNYRRLRYNVLKVLPYARYAGDRYRKLERDLATEPNKKRQKVLIKDCEKEIKDLFNKEIKDLTISQGEILIKLIDRETGNSSYSLLKDTKGGVTAFFMQSLARVFGHDLKTKYDVENDREIENIIRTSGYYNYR
ncbi:hypothetical protein Pedsa_2020 [Pseudopedobacter saltans DSM 12145]|uniref:DUF4294 domain-containing protein n=1 Tax=Pseudopedobacter saltans (strain ATCC 51119 / DSM 12145 / JCM 21818 / CCUG 39354 / LMG 10337 / NBRC 100064 / NCIMB 13643) TaxID=762903 RepID=F0SA14_PSESL|nr:DUF4294 domain-containing protein [Pseudopedobacter saltans]ADY52572.1 hypothetical protein Pedsa_2020 [Pseudopedobacter saltans DSM 12145]